MANFTGTSGDDHFNGTANDDNMSGAAGTWINSSGTWLFLPSYTSPPDTGNDSFAGGDGDDLILGFGGDDIILGGDGNDTIEGGDGADYMDGGPGDDDFIYRNGQDAEAGEVIIGGSSANTAPLAEMDFIVFESNTSNQTTDLRLAQISDIDGVEFRSGGNVWITADQVINGFNNSYLTLVGSPSRDVLAVFMGNITTLDLNTWDFNNNWGEGGDVIRFYGDASDEFISGPSYNVNLEIYGGAGNDILHGNAADDVIEGGPGLDMMYGHAGNDRFLFTQGEDSPPGEVVSGGILWGGIEHDIIVLDGLGSPNYTYDLSAADLIEIEGIEFVTGGKLILSADQLTSVNMPSPLAVTGRDTAGHKETITIKMDNTTSLDLTQWTFTNWGNQGEVIIIQGDVSAETIYGSQFDDYIISGGSVDKLYGQLGDDSFELSRGQYLPAGSIINGGKGNDTLILNSRGSYFTFDLTNTQILAIEALDINNGGGKASITASQVNTGLSSTLAVSGDGVASTVETIEIFMRGVTSIDLGGWRFQDWSNDSRVVIYGDADDEIFKGSFSHDVIVGGDGNDVFHGSIGTDTLIGGAHDDTFVYEKVLVGSGNIQGGTGYDILQVAGSIQANPFNFMGADFSSIEEIKFASGATAYFKASEFVDGSLGSATSPIVIRGYDVSGHTEKLVIDMDSITTLDARNWQLLSWGRQGEAIIFQTESNMDETVHGSQGNDELYVGGRDFLYGHAGDDKFIFYTGVSSGGVVDGGLGDDTITIYRVWKPYTTDLRLTSLSSIEKMEIQGSTVILDASQLSGFAPNLSVIGAHFTGQTETITINMEAETTLDISGWTFSLWGGQGESVEIIGDGNDESIIGSSTTDNINTAGGNDTVKSGGGNDTVITDTGKDTVYGGPGDDLIKGGGAVDTLYGEAGNDTIHGGTSGDTIYGGDNDDTIYGNGGDDIIHGGDGADTVDGGKYKDEIYGNAGDDILKGGGGGDTIDGGLDNDTIHGNSGHDVLKGGGGADTIYGNTGNDDLFGNIGDDTLHGGWGYDDMWGGGGVDTFVFKKRDWADRVKDFEDDVDIIDLTDWGFASVADALSHATEINGHVKFDFSSLPGAGSKDYLWVENITIAALQDDILV